MAVTDVDWQERLYLLTLRSGGMCEGRTPACIAPGGAVGLLPRYKVSIQHRRARGMGGSRLAETHTLDNLLLLCGSGTTGCHGWVENRERAAALARGLWIGHDHDDAGALIPASAYPLVLHSGRRVLLDPISPFYIPAPDPYGTGFPREADAWAKARP